MAVTPEQAECRQHSDAERHPADERAAAVQHCTSYRRPSLMRKYPRHHRYQQRRYEGQKCKKYLNEKSQPHQSIPFTKVIDQSAGSLSSTTACGWPAEALRRLETHRAHCLSRLKHCPPSDTSPALVALE